MSVADQGCLSRILGIQIFLSLISGPSRIRIKEFKYFLRKKLFLSFRNNDLGCHPGSRIPYPDPDFFHPGSRGQKSTRSRIWIRNTDIDSGIYSTSTSCTKLMNPCSAGYESLWILTFRATQTRIRFICTDSDPTPDPSLNKNINLDFWCFVF